MFSHVVLVPRHLSVVGRTVCELLLTIYLTLLLVSCGGGSSGSSSPPPPYLSLTASPSSLTTSPNSLFTVTVTASTNSGATPDLISTTLPAGITTTVALPMTIPAAGAEIDFQTSGSIKAGTYSVVLNGQAGSLTASTNVSVTVSTSGALQIQRVQPSRVMVGVPLGGLTLAGTGFTGSSTVLFDGVAAPTFFQGPNELEVEIPSSTWNVPQVHTVQVSNAGQGMSNIASYEVYEPQPGPTPFVGQITQYMAESQVRDGLVSDVNGDGRADLVQDQLNPNTSEYVPVVRYGQADGTFSVPNSMGLPALAFIPSAVVAGDFNGEQHVDLILIGGLANSRPTFQVVLNDGTGHFTMAGSGSLPITSPFLEPATVGDFNRDGKLDFAYGAADDGAAISLFYGHGDGTFEAPISQGPSGGNTYMLRAGDLNRDGLSDLVYVYIPGTGPNQIRELLSAANGSFTDSQLVNLPSGGPGFVLSDFDNDHIEDIFAVDSRGRGLAYLGIGDGTFRATGSPILASDLYFAAPPFVVGDFDHDGNADVATRTQLSGPDEVLFLFGDGKGNFTRQSQVSDHSFYLQVGDVNGDGIADIFAGVEPGFAYPSVVLGRNDRNFPSAQVLLPLAWGDLSTGDVFGDGFTDLLVSGVGNGGPGSVPGTIYHIQPDGTFATQGQGPEYATFLVDLNGDGIVDMLGYGPTSVLIWKGDGSGVFGSPTNEIEVPNGLQPVAVRDMDGDGHMDIVVPGAILYGRGDFQFDLVPIQFYQNFAVGDFDGDGIADIATPSGVLFGLGGRSFTPPTGSSPLQNDSGPFADQVVADMNGDGMDDLVLTTEIYLSVGRQGFGLDQSLMVNGYAAGVGSIAIADFNGDGRADIAMGLLGGGEDLVLFTNDGTGKYQVTSYAIGIISIRSVAPDFNRDGKPDLAFRSFIFDFIPPTVTVLMHK